MEIALMLTGLFVVLGAFSAWGKLPPPVERVEIRDEGLYVNGRPLATAWAAHWHFSLPVAD